MGLWTRILEILWILLVGISLNLTFLHPKDLPFSSVSSPLFDSTGTSS